jgi:hypothetical protein
VSVGVAVGLGLAVGVRLATTVGVWVGVARGDSVGVPVRVADAVALGSSVGEGEGVAVVVGVSVAAGSPAVALGDGLGEANTTVSVGVAVAVGEPASPANAPPLDNANASSPVSKANKERDIDEIDAPERISMARSPINVAAGRGAVPPPADPTRRASSTRDRPAAIRPEALPRGSDEAGRAPPQEWTLIMPCCASAAI